MVQYGTMVVFLLVLAVPVFSQDDVAAKTAEQREQDEFYDLLLIFADTIDQIDRNYVDRISRRELIEAAIEGALKKLDPYSNYIAPDEFDEFRLEVDNEFGGIGLRIGVENRQLKVISPIVGTPAYRAGIMAGDLILTIDGSPTKDFTLDEALQRLKGRADSQVTLSVFHPFRGETEDFTLTREIIKVETVMGHHRTPDDAWQFMLDAKKKIGYVRVTVFGRETAGDLKQALEKMKADGLRGLILDLRFNPGGLLRSAIETADLFLREGLIVSTDGRNIKPQQWEATEPGTFDGFPMVVLVNQFSASASEIVAAALQDHGRAVVVGERTYGKASIQNVIELEQGRSALKLTTGNYRRPNGQSIHRFPEAKAWGVQPNDGFEVTLSQAELQHWMAERQSRDVVRKNQPSPRAFEDKQLQRATEHLSELLAGKQVE